MATVDPGQASQSTQAAQELEAQSMRVALESFTTLAAQMAMLVQQMQAMRQEAEQNKENERDNISGVTHWEREATSEQASQTQESVATPSPSNASNTPTQEAVATQPAPDLGNTPTQEDHANNRQVSQTEPPRNTVLLPSELTLNGFISRDNQVKASSRESASTTSAPAQETPDTASPQKTIAQQSQVPVMKAVQSALSNPEIVKDAKTREKVSGVGLIIQGAKEVSSRIVSALSQGIERLRENFNSRSLADSLQRQMTVTAFAHKLLNAAGHSENGVSVLEGAKYRFERGEDKSLKIFSKDGRGEIFSLNKGVMIDNLNNKDFSQFLNAAKTLKQQDQHAQQSRQR